VLVVVGRAGIMPESRKNPKPEKCLKMATNPHHPLHALLGAVELEDSLTEKRHHRQPTKF